MADRGSVGRETKECLASRKGLRAERKRIETAFLQGLFQCRGGGGREPADELSFRYISVLKDLLLYRGKSGGVVSMAGNLGNLKQSAVQVPTPKRSMCCHQRFFVAGCDRRAKSPHG